MSLSIIQRVRELKEIDKTRCAEMQTQFDHLTQT